MLLTFILDIHYSSMCDTLLTSLILGALFSLGKFCSFVSQRGFYDHELYSRLILALWDENLHHYWWNGYMWLSYLKSHHKSILIDFSCLCICIFSVLLCILRTTLSSCVVKEIVSPTLLSYSTLLLDFAFLLAYLAPLKRSTSNFFT